MIIAVLGPTATGKSSLAIQLAQEISGEIINADALQLYRGMDIGTAKTPIAERAGIPHHVLDILAVTEEASVAHYQSEVEAAVAAVEARGRRAIVVGGSGLYVTAALDLLQIPPTDPQVRQQITDLADRLPPGGLHQQLTRLDPEAAAKILPGNIRRIVRALEVIQLTGRPFTASLPRPQRRRPTLALGLRLPTAALAHRIEHRVRLMWEQGLLSEVAQLAQQGLAQGRTASRAVGYAQALGQLSGEFDQDFAQSDTIRLTKRLARRQRSWFGRDDRIQWLAADAPDLLAQARAQIAAAE